MSEKDQECCMHHFEMQISEVEMVQSMYSNPGEFVMEDPTVLADMTDFIEGKTREYPSSRLDYIVNLSLDKVKLEVCCTFPYDYPTVEPEIYVRSQSLSREHQHQLNKDLMAWIGTLERGELCIGSALQWIQDNGVSYVNEAVLAELVHSDDNDEEVVAEKNRQTFSRYWIYSHHIYNKVKRKTILELAKELNISGFCLPGKPGIICAEGCSNDCSDFWHRIKHMNWKKIICKKKEKDSDTELSEEKFRRFNSFEEVAFEASSRHGRDFRMDMGEFLKYLEQHNCGYVFKDYFGIDGKIGSH